jgi:hypothetical protein
MPQNTDNASMLDISKLHPTNDRRRCMSGRSVLRLLWVCLIPASPISCAFEDADLIGESEHALLTTKTLLNDCPIDCDLREGRYVNGPETRFTVYLDPGDMVWIGGDSSVEYSEFGSFESLGNSTIEDVLTSLSCRAGTTPDPGLPPSGSYYESRTGQNVWATGNPPYGNLTDTHRTRTIFTAPPGAPLNSPYTCWMTYGCMNTGTNTPGEVTFLAGSTLKYYSTNQYPGSSWNQPAGENCDGILDSGSAGCEVTNDPVTGALATHTAQLETWYAEQLTAGDSEVVVTWAPLITNCISVDDDEPGVNERCDGLLNSDTDSYFRWRFGVYQRNDGTTCNKAFGTWSSPVLCQWRTHHCGADIYTDVFPIITGTGSEGISCGTSTANRNFKVFAQIRKVDTEDNDLVVESGGGGTFSNLMIYSR